MNRYLIVLLTATVMIGCLKTRAELEAEETGHQMEKQTVHQQQPPAPSRVGGQAAPKAAPVSRDSEEADEQIRTFNGRIESLEGALAQMRASEQQKKEAWIQDKTQEDKKLQAYEDAIRKLEAQVQALSEEVSRLKAPPAPEVEPPASGKKGGKNPFETGEEQFTSKKWKEAIVSFQKYRDQSPKGKSYADATYKIGVCFQELGMKDEAKSFMEEVTAKFPNSKEAKKAAFRLKSLK